MDTMEEELYRSDDSDVKTDDEQYLDNIASNSARRPSGEAVGRRHRLSSSDYTELNPWWLRRRDVLLQLAEKRHPLYVYSEKSLTAAADRLKGIKAVDRLYYSIKANAFPAILTLFEAKVSEGGWSTGDRRHRLSSSDYTELNPWWLRRRDVLLQLAEKRHPLYVYSEKSLTAAADRLKGIKAVDRLYYSIKANAFPAILTLFEAKVSEGGWSTGDRRHRLSSSDYTELNPWWRRRDVLLQLAEKRHPLYVYSEKSLTAAADRLKGIKAVDRLYYSIKANAFPAILTLFEAKVSEGGWSTGDRRHRLCSSDYTELNPWWLRRRDVLLQLAEKRHPLYVYSEKSLTAAADRLKGIKAVDRLYYSIKANAFPAILTLFEAKVSEGGWSTGDRRHRLSSSDYTELNPWWLRRRDVLLQLAEKRHPLYVYSEKSLTAAADRLKGIKAVDRLYYSIKANAFPAILTLFEAKVSEGGWSTGHRRHRLSSSDYTELNPWWLRRRDVLLQLAEKRHPLYVYSEKSLTAAADRLKGIKAVDRLYYSIKANAFPAILTLFEAKVSEGGWSTGDRRHRLSSSDYTELNPWWLRRRDVLLQLAEKRHPLYVYSEKSLTAAADRLKGIKAVDRLYYSIKANAFPAILTLFEAKGLCFECVSLGEVRHLFQVLPTLDAARVLFTANFAPKREYAKVLEMGVTVVLDSLHPLQNWPTLFAKKDVMLRFDPGEGKGRHKFLRTAGVGSKFGLVAEGGELRELKHLLASVPDCRVIGLHAHAGSEIMDAQHWADIGHFLLKLRDEHFPTARCINVGGGLGVEVEQGVPPLDLNEISTSLSKLKHDRGKGCELWLESGRYLTAESGVLLARVTQTRWKQKVLFVGLETGMNSLIRPALYSAVHPIVNLTRINSTEPTTLATVVGPICEAADVLGEVELPISTKEGDVMLIACAGAYGKSMAFNYNMRTPATEHFLKDKQWMLS